MNEYRNRRHCDTCGFPDARHECDVCGGDPRVAERLKRVTLGSDEEVAA